MPAWLTLPWMKPRLERLWQIREAAQPALYGLRGSAHPLAFVDDIGIPPEALREYLYRVQDLLRRHELTATFLIHAGTGQVNMRPFIDLRRGENVARMWTLAEEVYNLVLSLSGTISTQQGCGLARTPWVGQQYGPLYAIFRDLKSIFDPRHILNPGKIIGPVPGIPFWPVRSSEFGIRSEDATPNHTTPNSEPRTPSSFEEALACNGCGQCRTEQPPQRMCPIFRTSGDEAATPRAKPTSSATCCGPMPIRKHCPQTRCESSPTCA